MEYYHVIAKLEGEQRFRVLFVDLNVWNLKRRFISPYDRGKSFFVGNELIDSNKICHVQIIRTTDPNEIVRKEINRIDNQRIDAWNRESHGVFFVTAGAGHEPEDIAMGGDDVTKEFIAGQPGHRAWPLPGGWLGWVSGLASAVMAAGIAKFLGWV
ncbi:hypothetical protein L3D22_01175 [Lysobacter soli]|uniref:hypothetical protein n=1 Tax=Lysobacter TaxID=68 RepID=UPI0017890DD5|nr:hypothetical protein [Lysobacter soli]UTA54512.1 hypothetical protein L3D22_01175 [Lysobacter soli]